MSRFATREAITPTNQSPIFLIVTWIAQAAVLLVVGVKVLLSHTSTGIHADDWCILVAAALSSAQVIVVSFAGVIGIGRVQTSLSHDDLDIYEKAAYAAAILYVLSLVTSKLSVLLFLHQIAPFKHWRRIMVSVGIFTVLWGLSSVFVVAFQCEGPKRWDILHGRCIDRIAFWTVNSALNILIELALIFVPFTMFLVLLSSTPKTLILMFCFSLRFSVVAASAVQLYYLHHPVYPLGSLARSGNSDDYTFSTWPVFLTGQIVQSLSIITTCVPFMRNLFRGLQTGMIQTGHVSRKRVRSAISSRWNERSSISSTLMSSRRSNSVNAATTDIPSSNRHFGTNDIESAPLFGHGRPSSSSMIDHYTARLSDFSNFTTNVRHNRSHSAPPIDDSMIPMTHILSRSGSERQNRPGLPHSYTRGQVSTIAEEDEEDELQQLQYPDFPTALSPTRTHLDEDIEIEVPATVLDTMNPAERTPNPWRWTSIGGNRVVSDWPQETRPMRWSTGSMPHMQRHHRGQHRYL